MRGKKRPQTERVRAVALAEVVGAQAASEQTGIPRPTIALWMDRPEFSELRQKTRDELAAGFQVLAHLAMTRLLEQVKAGQVEPRDLTILLGVATDKHLLMSGDVTARTETRSLTQGFNDDEKRRLREFIDGIDAESPARPADAEGDPQRTGTEVR